MRWIPFPFIRIVLFFIAGILLGIHFPNTFSISFLADILGLLLVLCFLVRLIRYPQRKTIQGSITFFTVMVCGYFHVVYQNDSLHADHISNQTGTIEWYTAHLVKSSEERDHHWRTEAVIDRAKIDGVWENVQGHVQLYFSKADFPKPYKYGDGLLVKGNPLEVQAPANPGEFDYKRFLQFKNIYHQQFLHSDDVKSISNSNGFTILAWSYTARAWSDSMMKKYIQGEREQGIASALVLGVNDGLDNDLLNAYASSGTLHVLSVSGLHVGIVYLLIMLFLKPLTRFKVGRWIVAIVSVLILWGYAFVTGLSPSVLRAVAMFSFVALASPQGRRSNIYNTLSISAFCLLLYDPFLIMSVGFQLSYLAVLGIVYLQPLLYKRWEPQARILDEIWKVTSVSIAAQVATFSLGLLYFHQFPNYFLISNLLVIPLSFVVLVAGLGLLAFGFSHVLTTWIGFVLTWTIKIMNALVFYIDTLPFSKLEGIYITTFQCILLSVFVIIIIAIARHRKRIYLYGGVVIVLIFSILQWITFYENFTCRQITIYKVPNHFALDFFDQGIAHFVSDSSLNGNAGKIKFHIQPNRILHRVGQVQEGPYTGFIRKFKGGEVMLWNNVYILRLTDKDFILPSLPPIRYLVIGNNAVRDIIMLRKQLSFDKLIIDSSNSFYFAEDILKTSRDLGIDVYSVIHQGAFTDTY